MGQYRLQESKCDTKKDKEKCSVPDEKYLAVQPPGKMVHARPEMKLISMAANSLGYMGVTQDQTHTKFIGRLFVV